MGQTTEKKETNPIVRRVITLVEVAAAALLLWFPTMRLWYDEALVSEVPVTFFLENTPWHVPMQAVQWALFAAIVAASLPLFVRTVDRFWTMVVLTAAAGVSFLSHAALYIGCLLTVGERTYYGLEPQLSLTTAGLLYVVLAVFSLIEAVCTCVAIRREQQAESEVASDDGTDAC